MAAIQSSCGLLALRTVFPSRGDDVCVNCAVQICRIEKEKAIQQSVVYDGAYYLVHLAAKMSWICPVAHAYAGWKMRYRRLQKSVATRKTTPGRKKTFSQEKSCNGCQALLLSEGQRMKLARIGNSAAGQPFARHRRSIDPGLWILPANWRAYTMTAGGMKDP